MPMSLVARRDERIHVNLPVTLRVGWEGAMTIAASLVDLSERGAQVRAAVPFRLRQDVELEIAGSGEAKAYRVVWVRGDDRRRPQVYHAGLEMQ